MEMQREKESSLSDCVQENVILFITNGSKEGSQSANEHWFSWKIEIFM